MLRMILYFCQSVFFAEMSACFSAFRGKRMPGTSCRFRCSGKESSSCRTAWGRGVPPVRACGRRGCTELFRKACSCAGPGRAAETCIREHVQSAGAACPRGPGWRARGKHVPVIAFERERDSGLPEKQRNSREGRGEAVKGGVFLFKKARRKRYAENNSRRKHCVSSEAPCPAATQERSTDKEETKKGSW